MIGGLRKVDCCCALISTVNFNEAVRHYTSEFSAGRSNLVCSHTIRHHSVAWFSGVCDGCDCLSVLVRTMAMFHKKSRPS